MGKCVPLWYGDGQEWYCAPFVHSRAVSGAEIGGMGPSESAAQRAKWRGRAFISSLKRERGDNRGWGFDGWHSCSVVCAWCMITCDAGGPQLHYCAVQRQLELERCPYAPSENSDIFIAAFFFFFLLDASCCLSVSLYLISFNLSTPVCRSVHRRRSLKIRPDEPLTQHRGLAQKSAFKSKWH